MIPLLEGISLHDHICHEVSLTTRLPHFLRCTWWILLDHLSISTLGLYPPFCREDEYDYILKLRVQIHVCYMPLTTSNSPSASTSPQKDGGQLYDLLVMCYEQSASSVYVSLEVWLAPLVLKVEHLDSDMFLYRYFLQQDDMETLCFLHVAFCMLCSQSVAIVQCNHLGEFRGWNFPKWGGCKTRAFCPRVVVSVWS